MKYKYYGTVACEGIPALWCECRVCNQAREKGGRNVRTRSQQLIDDKLLIDFPADTFMHTLQGLPLTRIHTCIITHDHEDHFYPWDIGVRHGEMAYPKEEIPFNIYMTHSAYEHFKNGLPGWLTDSTPYRIYAHEITPFNSFETDHYKITPLKANHDPKANPVIYLIEKYGKCILHANDTGYFPTETWEFLKSYPVHIDFASFDCTEAGRFLDNDELGAHMNLPTVINVRKRLIDMGMIDSSTVCALNHFSHNGQYTYDEMCKIAEKDGFIVSYDGLEIEF